MNVALILAGGTGSRLGGDIPKQYLMVKDRPVIAYCMALLEQLNVIDGIWVVAEESWHKLIREYAGDKLKGFSAPGANRQLSIWNGLQDIAEFTKEEDIVIIHDAARPFVTKELIEACLEACRKHDGALPVLPMKDTVYMGEDGKILSLLDRKMVFAGQAPEAFRFGKYFAATKALLPDRILEINGSTEPAVLAGMDVGLVPGDEKNFKITTKEDLKRFQEMLE